MDYFSFFESFFQTSPHHAKLFRICRQVVMERPEHPFEPYLASILRILENMDDAFIEQRCDDFFKFLIDKLANRRAFAKSKQVCEITSFNHSITSSLQCKRVVGFFVNLKGVRDQAKKWINALCRPYEEVSPVKHSVLLLVDLQNDFTTFYFELQKAGGRFAPDEVQDLKEGLERHLTSLGVRSEAPVPAFASYADTLGWLMDELKREDPPHVMIFLKPEGSDELSLFVIACQFVELDTGPFDKLIEHPGIGAECQFREESRNGIKQGVVLRIGVPNLSSFLVERKEQVCQLVEKYIGPFQEVKGGLFEEIEKNFRAFSRKFDPSTEGLREFFESITPESERAVCSPTLLQSIYFAIYKKESYIPIEERDVIAVVVKIERGFARDWREILSKHLPRAGFTETLTVHRAIMSCFLYHPTQEEVKIFKTQTLALFKKWAQTDVNHTLRLCVTSRFNSFDPRTGTEEEASYLHKMLFEGLMRIGSRGKPEPGIAKKVTLSEDKKCYTFYLRKSFWSNGMPLTAHDFLYGWNMLLTRQVLAPLDYLLDVIENVQEIKKGQMSISSFGVDAIDTHTLEVRLQRPCPTFLERCALTPFFPICKAVAETDPAWVNAQGEGYICNGPFFLEKREYSGGVILRKNSFYWQSKKISLERVTIPVLSQGEGERLFRDKEVDALLHHFYKNCSPDLENVEAVRLQGAVSKKILCFNCLQPPFHNKKVRKAIALAIDRKEILQALPGSREELRAVPSFSFYSPFYPKLSKSINCPQNVYEARQLLIQALAEDPGVKETFFDQKISAAIGSTPLAAAICDRINTVFSAGWSVFLLNMNSRIYLERKGMIPASVCSWVDRIHDPVYFLETFSSKENFTNIPCWTHPLLQFIIKRVKIVKDQKKKEELLKKAEEILFEGMPAVPLFDVSCASFCHPYVQGIYASPSQEFDIRFASKEYPSIDLQ